MISMCLLYQLVIFATKIDFQHAEQSINNVLMLKTFVDGIKPIWQALTGVNSDELVEIRAVRHSSSIRTRPD
jgi:DNA mismatch repair protein MSH4